MVSKMLSNSDMCSFLFWTWASPTYSGPPPVPLCSGSHPPIPALTDLPWLSPELVQPSKRTRLPNWITNLLRTGYVCSNSYPPLHLTQSWAQSYVVCLGLGDVKRPGLWS